MSLSFHKIKIHYTKIPAPVEPVTMRPSTVLSVAALASVGSAYNLPANLKRIYDAHKASHLK